MSSSSLPHYGKKRPKNVNTTLLGLSLFKILNTIAI
jgi:hypothetical protein